MDDFEHAQAGKHVAPPAGERASLYREWVDEVLPTEIGQPSETVRDPDGHMGATEKS